jgi:hypothetical protein
MAVDDYTTLEHLKDYCEIPSTNTARDTWLARMIPATSRAIDDHCHRFFWPKTGSRIYDYQTAHRLNLKGDWDEITQILHGVDRAEAFDLDQCFFYPEIGPPYQWVEVSQSSTMTFRWSTLTYQQAIEVVGTQGYLKDGATPLPIEAGCCAWINYIRQGGGKNAGVQSRTIGDYTISYFQAMALLAQGPPAEAKTFIEPYVRRPIGTPDRAMG